MAPVARSRPTVLLSLPPVKTRFFCSLRLEVTKLSAFTFIGSTCSPAKQVYWSPLRNSWTGIINPPPTSYEYPRYER